MKVRNKNHDDTIRTQRYRLGGNYSPDVNIVKRVDSTQFKIPRRKKSSDIKKSTEKKIDLCQFWEEKVQFTVLKTK